MLKIPAPRLLPAAIAAMAALLLLKCGVLLNAAVTHGFTPDSVMVTVANAASTEQIREPAKPGAPVAQPKVTAPAPPPQASPLPAPPVGPPPVTESEKALLQELRQRRQDLEQRADAVATRESLLVAAEQKLTARVAELQALQARLEGLSAAQKQREEAGWQGLVKLYETMKPKDAATIFNDLAMPVLLQVMDRMKDAKAASVMAAMNPDKARDVTAELAQMRTGHDAAGAPVAGAKSNLTGS
jgi:flagellar motility protein MotE (MotC chaperone)